MKIVFNDCAVKDQRFFPIESDEFIQFLEYQQLIPKYVIPRETIEIPRNPTGTSGQSPQTASTVPTLAQIAASFDEEDKMITLSEIVI